MYEWVKKIHMYAGLFTFTAFFIWGVTGIYAIFLPPPGEYEPPEISSEREVTFQSPGDVDDKDLAQQIFERIEVPLSGGHYNVHRDDDLNLAFFVFTWNGMAQRQHADRIQSVGGQAQRPSDRPP
jgi:uncharacterized iron-regulated membrane protein